VSRRGLRRLLGTRFARFAGAAAAALTATEITLSICNGLLHLTATPAALASWFAGALVSYTLSRWAWNRTGRPDVLRETLPFWLISVMVIVLLTLANKLGYHSAAWPHLTGVRHVLWVDFVWLLANLGTFLLRFAIFHYVLFADRGPRAGLSATVTLAATGPGATARPAGAPRPPGTPGGSAQPPGQVADLGPAGAAGDLR
jgi:putative flippase GtrA